MDPFEDPFWTLNQALAWVRWRDPERLREYSWGQSLAAERIYSDRHPPFRDNDTDRDSEDVKVTRALQRGEITAIESGRKVEHFEWATRDPLMCAGLKIARDEILARWPAAGTTDQPTAVERSAVEGDFNAIYEKRVMEFRSIQGRPPTLAQDQEWRKGRIKRDHLRELRRKHLSVEERKGGAPHKKSAEKLGKK